MVDYPRIPFGRFLLIELINDDIHFGIVRDIGCGVDKSLLFDPVNNPKGLQIGDIVMVGNSLIFGEIHDYQSEKDNPPTYALYPVEAIMGFIPPQLKDTFLKNN